MLIVLPRYKNVINAFMTENQPSGNPSLIPKINIAFIYCHCWFFQTQVIFLMEKTLGLVCADCSWMSLGLGLEGERLLRMLRSLVPDRKTGLNNNQPWEQLSREGWFTVSKESTPDNRHRASRSYTHLCLGRSMVNFASFNGRGARV